MRFLSLEDLLELHALLVTRFGGSAGVRDIGRLEAAIATQAQQVFGVELYKSAHDKAAALMRGIIADHPFYDGNKRTGTLAGLTLLELNNLRVAAVKGEIEDFAVQVAVEQLMVEQISAWLQAHTV